MTSHTLDCVYVCIKRWLSLSLCLGLMLQTFLFDPNIANAVDDVVAPTISGITPADGAVTDNAFVVISGTFSDSDSGVDTGSLWLDIDGVPFENAAIFTDDTFSYAPISAYDDGLHTVAVSIADYAGNRMSAVEWSFTIASAPIISGVTVSGGNVVVGAINSTNTGLTVGGEIVTDAGIQTVVLYLDGGVTPLASTIVLPLITSYLITLSPAEFAALSATDGLKHLQARRIGSTFNHSVLSASFDINVDKTAPVIAAHADITVEATSSAGAVVAYLAPEATDNFDLTAPADCLPVSGSTFPLGDTTVNCAKTDAAGNSAAPTAFTVTVLDTTAPIGAISIRANTISNISDPELYTRGVALKLTLSATDNVGTATMSFKDDQSTDWSAPTTYAPSSSYSYSLSDSTDGARTVYVQYCDAAGNCSENSDQILFDDHAPSSATNPIDGDTTDNKQLQFSWSAVSDLPAGVNSGIQYYQLSVQKQAPDLSWGAVAGLQNINVGIATSYQLDAAQAAGLADGIYRVNVQARDNAGNLGSADYSDGVILDTTISVDTTAPVLTQVTPVASPTSDPHYVFNSTEAGVITYFGSCLETTATAAAIAGDNNIALTGLSPGLYSDCALTVTDTSLNQSLMLSIPEFVIVATLPIVTVNLLLTNDRTPPLSGAINDAAAVISVRVNGVDYPATNNGATWSLADNLIASLADGVYDIAVTATDALGNVGYDSTTNELTIDTLGPIVSEASPTGSITEHRPVISITLLDTGSGVNASSVVVRINGVAVATLYDAATGSFSFTPSRDLGNRTYRVTIDGRDNADNAMTRYSISFTIE